MSAKSDINWIYTNETSVFASAHDVCIVCKVSFPEDAGSDEINELILDQTGIYLTLTQAEILLKQLAGVLEQSKSISQDDSNTSPIETPEKSI